MCPRSFDEFYAPIPELGEIDDYDEEEDDDGSG